MAGWRSANLGDANNDQAAQGKYSTNQAVYTFLADNPAVRLGAGDLQVSAFEYNTFSQMPQLPWQNTMALNSYGGLDSFTIAQYKTDGLLTTDGESRPVATARCRGRTGYCAASVVAFQNGLIGTAGSNTAHNQTTVKLAANKVPTAITVTNMSEFALVTVWDTVALKGQVAVIALAGLCDGCKAGGPYYEWWGEWEGVYPGLPNMGNIAYMKVLGYVDLPGDMKAPTEISRDDRPGPVPDCGSRRRIRRQGRFALDGSVQPRLLRLRRQCGQVLQGGRRLSSSRRGAKSRLHRFEALFNYVNSVYFGGQHLQHLRKSGPADNQWPHAFAFAGQSHRP